MIAVLVPIDLMLAQGVPFVLIQGPPTVPAVMAAIRGVSTGVMFVIHPDHPPVHQILGQTGSNHLSKEVSVYGAVVEVIKEQSAGDIHGRYQPLVAIVSTCIIRLICAVLRIPDT